MHPGTERDKKKSSTTASEKAVEGDQLTRQIQVLYDFLGKILGEDSLDRTIEGMDLEDLITSSLMEENVLALHKLVFKDKEAEVPELHEIHGMLVEIEDGMADLLARRTVEHRLEQQVAHKMEKQQHKYMNEIKLQIMNKKSGPENGSTLRKYVELEKLEHRRLSGSAMEMMRPSRVEEIVGQDRAIKALITKLATPYPRHVLIYGPPGVGKTTAARLVLEMAKEMPYTPFADTAKFVEVDGTTLRWDPREIINPLLGSVHDPIYQGTRKELADSGTPEPKTGLVTEAHSGVLFIDEIGELDPQLQNKLLKVLEDKRVSFDSSYYDPDDENIPKYVKKLFDEGAPADFILIGATTRHPSELNPALRSRCTEVFFEPLAPESIRAIAQNAAGRLGISLESGVTDTISLYTMEGRKAVSLLTDAYGIALFRNKDACCRDIVITCKDMDEVLQISRLTPHVQQFGSHNTEIGRIFGLGVQGFLGSVIEFEAIAFPAATGKGNIRFNETAGSMTKDSLTNAASVIRKLTGEDIGAYDLHVNAIGGGMIDGPSAGAALVLLLLSAIENKPLWQDIAVTGEISLQGRLKPVGGIFEKINGAKQAGMRKIIIPKDNIKDIPVFLEGIEVIPIETIDQALLVAFEHQSVEMISEQTEFF